MNANRKAYLCLRIQEVPNIKIQRSAAEVLVQWIEPLPAADLERWANPIGRSHYATLGRAF